MKAQLKHLPHMVGYYVTEVGTLNMIVHMWAYESLDQREKCRAAMSGRPGLAGVPGEDPPADEAPGDRAS